MNQKTLIVITGPTASGKSALAVDVALTLRCDIISADSRQIYADLPIVSARITPEEQRGVRHHLLGILPLDAYFSASLFEQQALFLIDEQFKTSDFAIVCGGSMMYIDALCNGIDELPTISPSLRSELASQHAAKGDAWLLEKLRQLDSTYYNIVDRKNIKRVFHAVEISIQAGAPYSSLITGEKKQRDFRILKFALSLPRPKLFSRINTRVNAMIEAGLIDEARRLYPKRHLNSLNTVGLKELFAAFDGIMTLPEAIERIKKNTRVYAKKQLTWLQRDNEIITIEPLRESAKEIIISTLRTKLKSSFNHP